MGTIYFGLFQVHLAAFNNLIKFSLTKSGPIAVNAEKNSVIVLYYCILCELDVLFTNIVNVSI